MILDAVMKPFLGLAGGVVAVLAVNRKQSLVTNAVLVVAALAAFRFGIVSLSSDQLAGGRADGRRPSDFDPQQLAIGTRVELEHTRDENLAREIAMDHLVEDPAYYTKLVAAGL